MEIVHALLHHVGVAPKFQDGVYLAVYQWNTARGEWRTRFDWLVGKTSLSRLCRWPSPLLPLRPGHLIFAESPGSLTRLYTWTRSCTILPGCRRTSSNRRRPDFPLSYIGMSLFLVAKLTTGAETVAPKREYFGAIHLDRRYHDFFDWSLHRRSYGNRAGQTWNELHHPVVVPLSCRLVLREGTAAQ